MSSSFQEALEEWNVLQATLRQVSGKLSDSLLAVALGCLVSLAILGEHLLFAPEARWRFQA